MVDRGRLLPFGQVNSELYASLAPIVSVFYRAHTSAH